MPDKEDDLAKSYHELTDGSIFAIGGESSRFNVIDSNPDSSLDDLQERIDRTENELEKDKYSIKKEVARGGMGAILEVEDRELKRIIAMKVLKNCPLSESRELFHISDIKSYSKSAEIVRFIREARITGKLEHPNIIPIHDLGIDENNRPFFTMKMIKGKTLSEIIKSNSDEYSLRKLLKVFIQCCNAVSFAHSQNVIHRDIKSDNIMIGEYGEVLVMDWGLAKIAGEEEPLLYNDSIQVEDVNQTQVGTIIGTPSYMSPEQAKGDTEHIDTRSDIFSLGAVLYEILNKVPPYNGKNTQSNLTDAINANLEFEAKKTKIPKEIIRICKKALSKNREDRYQSVNEFSDDIQAFLDNRVIPKYNLSIWKNIWQNMAVVGIFCVFVMILNSFGISELGLYLDIVSIVIIIGFALLYQFLCHGESILFIYKKNTEFATSTLSSIQFQNGAFMGGVFGSVTGICMVLTNLNNSEYLGANFGMALITMFYAFPIFLLLRLNYIKKARKMSLFEIISPFSKYEIIKIGFFLIMIISIMLIMFFVFLYSESSIGNLNVDIYDFLNHSFQLLFSSLILSIILLRMVFTFKELFAALSHLFQVLSGGEVYVANKIHSACVLRLFTEINIICIFMSCFIRIIAFLAELDSINYFLNYFSILTIISIISFLIYIFFNIIINKYLIRSNKTIESNSFLNDSMIRLYKEQNSKFWTDTFKGKIKLIFTILLLFSIDIIVFNWSASPILSPAGLIGILLIVLLIGVAALNIKKLKREFYKTNKKGNCTE